MRLEALQSLFFRAARGQASPTELDEHFVARGERTGAGRMRIYNGAYFARLDEAMADSFPATRCMLGETRFRELARRYVIRHPSRQPALEHLGAEFPFMLSSLEGATEQLAAQVALLERARTEALLAPNSQVLSRADLRLVDASTSRFCWVPSLRLRTCTLAALRCLETAHEWQSHQRATDAEHQVTVVFWRRGFQVHQRTLDALEVCALKSTERDISLVELCARLEGARDDVVASSFTLMTRWLDQGFMARVDPHAPSGLAKDGSE